MSKDKRKTKGNPIFLAFAIIAIVAAIILFALLMLDEKKETVGASESVVQRIEEAIARRPPRFPDHKAGGSVLVNTLDGESYDLTDFGGKIVLVNFWATWCPPCVKEIPDFIELQNEYGSDGFLILGLSSDNQQETVEQFVEQRGVNFPVSMVTREAIVAFGPIEVIPTSFLIDYKNEIRYSIRGAIPKSEWDEMIRKIIIERDEKPI